jgi:leader peptidase (prepilin peptidase) / N-methyltransferase
MYYVLVVIAGLVFGSFIAAYSYRYPRDIKISKGFSFCDNCKRKIGWYENIPVLSYFLLRGKCMTCKKNISPRYPIIEFISALAFVLLFKYNGSVLNLSYLLLLIFYFLLALIFIIDLEHQIIPDDFVFFGIALSFLCMLFSNKLSPFSSVFSGLTASTFLLTIFLITKGRGMGLGDVKFAVLGGMLVGINNLFVWMLSAFLTGAIVGIILILGKNAKLKDKIAFGPFLVIAIPITFIWGQKLISLFGGSLL